MIYCGSLDRTGEGKLFFNQVGDLIRGLGFKPTNKDVAGVLGNPKKEEMNTKTCTFDDFLGYVKGSGNQTQNVHHHREIIFTKLRLPFKVYRRNSTRRNIRRFC